MNNQYGVLLRDRRCSSFFNDSFCKVHFDRKSCLLMGKRYAKVYADMSARP